VTKIRTNKKFCVGVATEIMGITEAGVEVVQKMKTGAI